MNNPGEVPSAGEATRRLASQAVVAEVFTRLDAGDVDGALALHTEDAVFLGVAGKATIREVMVRGMAPHAGRRSRHVIATITDLPLGPADILALLEGRHGHG